MNAPDKGEIRDASEIDARPESRVNNLVLESEFQDVIFGDYRLTTESDSIKPGAATYTQTLMQLRHLEAFEAFAPFQLPHPKDEEP